MHVVLTQCLPFQVGDMLNHSPAASNISATFEKESDSFVFRTNRSVLAGARACLVCVLLLYDFAEHETAQTRRLDVAREAFC